MDSFANKIKDTAKYIPILTIILFFFSFVGNYAYYDRYRISIIEFFESSDYLGIFFDDLIYLAMYLFVLYIINQAIHRRSGSGIKKLSNQVDQLDRKLQEIRSKTSLEEIKTVAESILSDAINLINNYKRIAKRWFNILYYLFACLIVVHFINYVTSGISVFLFFIQFATAIIICYQIDKCTKYINSVGYSKSSQEVNKFDLKEFNRVSDPITYMIYFNIILTCIITYNRGIKDSISFGRSDRVEYLMSLNDSTITTNDSLKYLGSTKNYFFLYEATNDKSIVLKRSEVKKFEILKKSRPKENDQEDAIELDSLSN